MAVGASGMAQNFGEDSTQGSMLVTVSDAQITGELTLTDAKGQTLVSCSPAKEYNSVLISCPALKKGETYTLTTGDTTTTVEMSSLVYGTGEQGQRGGEKTGKAQNPQNPGKTEDSGDGGIYSH